MRVACGAMHLRKPSKLAKFPDCSCDTFFVNAAACKLERRGSLPAYWGLSEIIGQRPSRNQINPHAADGGHADGSLRRPFVSFLLCRPSRSPDRQLQSFLFNEYAISVLAIRQITFIIVLFCRTWDTFASKLPILIFRGLHSGLYLSFLRIVRCIFIVYLVPHLCNSFWKLANAARFLRVWYPANWISLYIL